MVELDIGQVVGRKGSHILEKHFLQLLEGFAHGFSHFGLTLQYSDAVVKQLICN